MIQIELTPEIEARFADAARAHGLQPDAYASHLIASAALTAEKHLSHEEVERFLTEMSRHSDRIPALSDSAYTRESFYQDHD
ncbi:MAG: hypothetical protein JST61_01640 [Acidobacteria bacterium]|nr:hypothetical protein [Acidobacteriota bacterium]